MCDDSMCSDGRHCDDAGTGERSGSKTPQRKHGRQGLCRVGRAGQGSMPLAAGTTKLSTKQHLTPSTALAASLAVSAALRRVRS